MTNRLTESVRRAVERLLPWFDRAERDRRAARTQRKAQRAIAVRIRGERIIANATAKSRLDSYARVRIGR